MQFMGTDLDENRADDADASRAERVAAMIAFAERARREADLMAQQAQAHRHEADAAREFAKLASARLIGFLPGS
jgi:hypothetical protein